MLSGTLLVPTYPSIRIKAVKCPRDATQSLFVICHYEYDPNEKANSSGGFPPDGDRCTEWEIDEIADWRKERIRSTVSHMVLLLHNLVFVLPSLKVGARLGGLSKE